MAGSYRFRYIKNYIPFLLYMKQKHGVNVIYEILYGVPMLPPNETVEEGLP